MVRKKSGNLRKKRGKSGKSQGILTGCPNVKVSPLLKLNLIAVSAKMLYHGVMGNSLRSGRSRGEVRENEKGLKWSGKSQGFEKKEENQEICQGVLTGCPNVKVSPLLKFNLIVVSAKMLYQGVMGKSLRSGRSQGK